MAVPKGHGRNGADAYRGARIEGPHPSLTAGDACPACAEGIVYEKAQGVLVRITGQPPLAARAYQLQKLWCHLCGQVFTAEAPEAAGKTKYDADGRRGLYFSGVVAMRDGHRHAGENLSEVLPTIGSPRRGRPSPTRPTSTSGTSAATSITTTKPARGHRLVLGDARERPRPLHRP